MARPYTRQRQRSRSRSHPRSPKKSPTQLSKQSSPHSHNQLLANKPLGKRLVDSDDSDELVVKGIGQRRSRQAHTVDVFVSGALGSGDKPNAHPTRAQRRKQLQDAMKSGKTTSESPSASAKSPLERVAPESARSSSVTAPAVRAPQPPPSAQPTPLREESLLNGIRPRKRQNSILQDPGLDDTTLGSFALPDDINSPLNLPPRTAVATSSPAIPTTSSSKKRKLNSDDVPSSPGKSPSVSGPHGTSESPSAALPRALEPRNVRHVTASHDDDDEVMAPPISSSSAPTSPAKPSPIQTKKANSRSQKPPAKLTTQELQAQLMPTKRQKDLRKRQKRTSEFDIPSDTDPAPSQEDSTFLEPGKHRATRRSKTTTTDQLSRRKGSGTSAAGGVVKPPNVKGSKGGKKAPPSRSTTTKLKTKSTAPSLLPSRRSRPAATSPLREADQPAKSPSSQLSSSVIVVATPPNRRRFHTTRINRAETSTSPSASAKRARAGGSPLNHSLDSAPGGNEGDSSSDKENSVAGGAAALKLPSPVRYGGRWAEIDDFEMDFEDVELPSVSSDPLAR
jgi:hypothetical protein